MSDLASTASFPAALATRDIIPAANLKDTFLVAADVIVPTIAMGPIIRRPRVMAIAELLDLNRRAVRRMQWFRRRYGTSPLRFRIFGRDVALLLAPNDVHRVLQETPEPFSTATMEKTAALSHFEPKNVLISQGADRAQRRRFNEKVLDTNCPRHRLAAHFLEVVEAEREQMLADLPQTNVLTWNTFSTAWFRIVRRVIFGDRAREDHALSREMYRLRSAANWAFLRPKQRDLRESLLGRIRWYLQNPDPAALTGIMSNIPRDSHSAPEHQPPQWLFAFDPAGMATFRALALLATHPDQARVVRAEVESGDDPTRMPTLRASVLESLRLWPTTPLILRETSTETTWNNGTLPSGAAVTIFTPFFHRDDEQLPEANRFSPDLWIADQPRTDWPIVPFSEGSAVCPGRELVLLLTTAMLADLLRHGRYRLRPGSRLRRGAPVPATLNHFALSFDVRR